MPTNRLERFAHNLDWNLLRTFVVVVEEGSITKAANRLLLQQPAVSMALKRLEQTVGHKLIDRRPGRFDLTEAGARLHALCRDIFTSVVRLPEAMESSGEEISGHITIHTVSHALNPDWDRALASFFRLHPRVTAGVKVETTSDVIRSVERGVATLGISDGIIPAGLDCAPFCIETYALYCGRGHRLFGAEGIRIEELRGEPYVSFISDVLGGPHMGPVTAVRAIGSFGQQVRAIAFNVEEVLRLVIADAGIGMLPVHLAAMSAASGDLWQLPPYDSLPQTETFRITNPGAALNPAERAFLAHMADVPLWQHPSA
ncbi:LysR family transcriptional regulator [Mycoplana rhizolycopersici]|uniref:LysR family transcriptional regulator n=1 Tax=Mycoplana rhizolycopersici TaxID=2746702 RepID=A0ABX2QCX9_9HYPH|nr:LysR family transcriptional regulator [Rhizobium rhizolycopersici]NVP54543.1 LysR family transcriptional regulator [Rhizobium rhizolycopersici]